MSLAVSFSNVVEMFHHLVKKYSATTKPYLLRKRDGVYVPLTHREVADMVLAFSAGLAELGIKHGDRIAILAENRPEWVVADFGILAMQCVGVPIFPSQTAKQVEFIVEDAGAVAIVVSNQFQLAKAMKVKDAVRGLKHIILMNEAQPDTPPSVISFAAFLERGRASRHHDPDLLRKASDAIRGQDLCTIIYTSGTTGNPKGVMLTHANFVSNITAASQILPINSEDTLLSFLPLCHVFERMAGYYTVSACGSTIAYAESIETVADNMIEVKPTIVVAVPRLFERMYTRIARRVEKDSAGKRKIFYWAVAVGRAFVAARKRGRVPFALKAKHGLAEKLVFAKLKERMGGRIRFYGVRRRRAAARIGRVLRGLRSHHHRGVRTHGEFAGHRGQPAGRLPLRVRREGPAGRGGAHRGGRRNPHAGTARDGRLLQQPQGHRGIHRQGRLAAHGRHRHDRRVGHPVHHRPEEAPLREFGRQEHRAAAHRKSLRGPGVHRPVRAHRRQAHVPHRAHRARLRCAQQLRRRAQHPLQGQEGTRAEFGDLQDSGAAHPEHAEGPFEFREGPPLHAPRESAQHRKR
ncbi:MAG: AMP-binding protein [Ignavibacteria bacterium]|nr:AMP-binding protein [Ignavibacteria bacterium]